MYCRKCGKCIDPGETFCSQCGNKIADSKEICTEKISEKATDSKPKKTKKQILRFIFFILSTIISVVGIAILFWVLSYLVKWFFNSLQAPPQYFYDSVFLNKIRQSINAHDWIFILVPTAILLFIINMCIAVKKRKKGVWGIFSLCLSIVFLTVGVVSYGLALSVIFKTEKMRTPYECLSYYYDEDEVQSIMEDLEQYGFVAQDSLSDNYLTILDTDGTAKVCFPIEMSESISEAFQFFLNNSVLGATSENDWYAVVNDGAVTDIYIDMNTDIYMYVENGVLTENPCSNYLSSRFFPVEFNHWKIMEVVEKKIAEKYNVSKEEINFLWEGIDRDRENSTLDVWQAYIHGSFMVNEHKYTVYITLTAKPDEEIYTLMENYQTDSWSFYVKYYINE